MYQMQVGELFVQMALDMGNYERGLQQAEQQGKTVAQKLSGDYLKTGDQLSTAVEKPQPVMQRLANTAQNTGQRLTDAGESARIAGTKMQTAGTHARSMGDGLQSAGMLAAGFGAAITLGFGAAINHVASFEQQMSTVKAVSGATGQEFNKLSALAQKLGEDTKFSSTEAAQGMAELIKSGISTTDVMGGGLAGALSLAAAGDLDVASAAEIASNAMNMFGLKGKDMGMVADLMAGAANASSVEVKDLQYSLSMVGNVASSAGLNIKEVTSALALMGKEGLKNSDAGTSLKQMLLSLQAPTDKARKLMAELGMSFYDSSGKMKSLDQIAAQLQSGMSKLTQEQRDEYMATLFGSDAVRAANIIYKNGAQGVNSMAEAISKKGEADRIAAEKMNNLNGAIEKMKGAFSSLLTAALLPLLPKLQSMVTWLGGIVDKATSFAQAHPILTQFGFVLGALVGIALLVGGAFTMMAAMVMQAGLVVSAFTFGIPILIGLIATLAITVIANWSSIKDWLVGIWNTIAGFSVSIWNQIVQHIMAVWSVFAPYFQAYWTALSAVFTAVWESIKVYIQTVWDVIKTIFATAFLLIYFLVTGQWDQIGLLFHAAGEKFKTIIQNAWDNIKTIWSSAFEALKTVASNAWNALKDRASSGMTAIWQTITNIWDQIKEYFRNLPDEAMNWGRNMINGFVDGIMSAVDSVRQAVSSVVNAAKGFLGFNSPAKEGDGRYIVQWGQNMIGGFMDGIRNRIPELQSLMGNTLKLPSITSKMTSTSPAAASLASGFASLNNSTVNHYTFAPGSIVIPAKDLDEMRTIQDFFARLPQVARAGGV